MTIHTYILVTISFLFIYLITDKLIRFYYSKFLIINTKIISDLYKYNTDKCLDYLTSTKITPFLASKVKPDSESKESIMRDFIKLFYDICGPNNIKLLSDFFGSESILINNLVLDFNTHLDSSEIQQFIQNMSNLEQSTLTTFEGIK